MRRVSSVIVLLSALAFCFPAYTHAANPPPTATPTGTAQPAAHPAAPTGLTLALPHSTQNLTGGSWISSTHVDVGFAVTVGGSALTPQAEIEASGTAFSGQPNVTGAPMTASGKALLPVQGLQNGQKYHVEVRVADESGNASAWVPYSSLDAAAVDFGVDTSAPTRPVIHSSTDPNQNRWYNTVSPIVTWSAQDSASGIRGYSFALERQAQVLPPGTLTSQTGARLSNLTDGIWFLAIRAQDRAGNWSPTTTFRIQLDRKAPHLTWLSPNRLTLNPYRAGATVQFRVDKQSSVTLHLYRVGSSAPVASFSYPQVRPGQVLSVFWSGKTRAGRPEPRGFYFFSATVVDHASNRLRVNVGGIALDPVKPVAVATGVQVYANGGKRIVVSLSRQTLYAYDGTRLVQQTFVTTGNPNLPTPAGHYTILAKYHPFEFISPWPVGSPYWYAPSLAQYAMLFRSGGYFLHDAPWRSAFGPGTNGAGQPGTNYGGTHGCVNIPPGPMLFLWNWAPEGTPVDVVP